MLQQMLHECHVVVTWTKVEGKGTPQNPFGVLNQASPARIVTNLLALFSLNATVSYSCIVYRAKGGESCANRQEHPKLHADACTDML